MRSRRSGRLALLGLTALALGACSPSHGGASAISSPSSISIPPPATSSVDPSGLPVPSDWPDQDTPIGQASAQLQMAWDPYGVTIIPSRDVFDSMPAVPTVLNETGGALSDAQAQEMGLAYYRTDALWGWADAHDQMKFQLYLSNQGYLNTAAGEAESAGDSVIDPVCVLYPIKLAIVPVDQSIVTFEGGVGYTVHTAYALVEEYGGSVSSPCQQTADTSAGPEVTWTGPAVDIETGSVHTDPLLGLTWFGESDRDCPSSNVGLPAGFGTPPAQSGTTPVPEPDACDLFG